MNIATALRTKIDEHEERLAAERAKREEERRTADVNEQIILTEALRSQLANILGVTRQELDRSAGWSIVTEQNGKDVTLMIDGCKPLTCYLIRNPNSVVCVRFGSGPLDLHEIMRARKEFEEEQERREYRKKEQEEKQRAAELRNQFREQVWEPWLNRYKAIIEAIGKECAYERDCYLIEYGLPTVEGESRMCRAISYQEVLDNPWPTVKATLIDGATATIYGVALIENTTGTPPYGNIFGTESEYGSVSVWFDKVERAKQILEALGGFEPMPTFAEWASVYEASRSEWEEVQERPQ